MKRHLERYHNNQNPTIDGVPIDINNIVGRNKITGRKSAEESSENMDHGHDHGHDHGTEKGYSLSERLISFYQLTQDTI